MPSVVRGWIDCAGRWSRDACRWGEVFVLALGTFVMVATLLYMANRADLLQRQVADNYRALLRLRDYTLARDARWEEYVRDRDAKWAEHIRDSDARWESILRAHNIPIARPDGSPSP
jgi:predicted Holliday junction resolvase-like endonuclease